MQLYFPAFSKRYYLTTNLAFLASLAFCQIVFNPSGCVGHYSFSTEAQTPLKIFYGVVFRDHK